MMSSTAIQLLLAAQMVGLRGHSSVMAFENPVSAVSCQLSLLSFSTTNQH